MTSLASGEVDAGGHGRSLWCRGASRVRVNRAPKEINRHSWSDLVCAADHSQSQSDIHFRPTRTSIEFSPLTKPSKRDIIQFPNHRTAVWRR